MALRDYLRAHPDACARYALVKQQAVLSGKNRLLSYSEAKSPLIQELIDEAMQWRRRLDKRR
jgi:GrpB-like predicted nucleotidyltransferase (UPF0157 family)